LVEGKKGDFVLREEVEVVFEKKVTLFGNSKVDVSKRYIGWRAYESLLGIKRILSQKNCYIVFSISPL